MKRLKQLREGLNLTQQELAQKLKTSQQAIARWENGKTEPNLAALKDLAMFFGTSVDELLNYEATGKKPATKHRSFSRREFDGFWGHIGLKVAGKPSLWFPITEDTMNEVYEKIQNIDKENEWLMFETLANKFVACRPEGIEKIMFVDDDSDAPQDDWNITFPYDGLPLEIYNAFEVLSGGALSPEDAVKLRKIMAKKGKLTDADRQTWKGIIKKIAPFFEGKASEQFVSEATEQFVKNSLDEWEKYYQAMLAVNVYYENGTVEDFDSVAEDLDNLIFSLDNMDIENPKFANLTSSDHPVFIPLSISPSTISFASVNSFSLSLRR